jgi:glyoxylate reductase
MTKKPKVYFTSNVFTFDEIGSNQRINEALRSSIKNLWYQIKHIADIEVYDGRFPETSEIQAYIKESDPTLLGCHLSHPISAEILQSSNLIAVCTATVGYNHIQIPNGNTVLITHTPGVLHEAVADYTIALIMSNLRNLIDLHNYVWSGNWNPSEKWDMDQNLSNSLNNQVLGIIGLGEIGSEIAKKLQNCKIKILYFDIQRRINLENQLPNLEYMGDLEDIFKEADIISLHVPLNKKTTNLIDRNLLKFMKNNSLLINTARGQVLNLNDFLTLLEKGEIFVNFAFDVYPQEPIDKNTLKRIKAIKELRPEIRINLMPHNASADANTRARMVILFLNDIIKLIKSKNFEDLKDVHIIPEQRNKLQEVNWRINKYWLQR